MDDSLSLQKVKGTGGGIPCPAPSVLAETISEQEDRRKDAANASHRMWRSTELHRSLGRNLGTGSRVQGESAKRFTPRLQSEATPATLGSPLLFSVPSMAGATALLSSEGSRGLKVLRLCSVFEPPTTDLCTRFDPIGGVQNHTAELSRSLARRGVRQTVVTTRPPGAPRYQRLAPNTEVIRLGWNVGHMRQLYAIHAASLLSSLARTADVVHVHLGEDLAILPLAMRAAANRRAALVMTVHCSLRHTLQMSDLRTVVLKTIGGFGERLAARRSSAVIAITARMASRLAEEGVDPRSIYVIPPGVSRRIFRGDWDDPFPGIPHPRVAFVGRVVKAKGVFDLAEAIPTLPRDAQVLFVGNGPDRPALERRLDHLRVRDRAAVTGFVPHDRIPAVLANIDVLVLPSHYEELGSVLIEGMQSGLPLVGSRTGGIPDAISHEENGLLFTPRDVRGLSDAINRILEDGFLARRLRAEGGRRAHRYDWDELSGQVLDVYRNVTTGLRESALL
jgi:glycogen synthase